MIEVELSNQQASLAIDPDRLVSAVQSVLKAEQVKRATISLAILDDRAIHELNRKYLSHDYATDVLSFLLQEDDAGIEGEVIVSAEAAARVSAEYDWPADAELLLYVIHGTLHLVGYDDRSPNDRAAMRQREDFHLRSLGTAPPPRSLHDPKPTTPAGNGRHRRGGSKV